MTIDYSSRCIPLVELLSEVQSEKLILSNLDEDQFCSTRSKYIELILSGMPLLPLYTISCPSNTESAVYGNEFIYSVVSYMENKFIPEVEDKGLRVLYSDLPLEIKSYIETTNVAIHTIVSGNNIKETLRSFDNLKYMLY